MDFTDFMLATGLRIGEAAAVTWDALDLDAGTVHGDAERHAFTVSGSPT